MLKSCSVSIKSLAAISLSTFALALSGCSQKAVDRSTPETANPAPESGVAAPVLDKAKEIIQPVVNGAFHLSHSKVKNGGLILVTYKSNSLNDRAPNGEWTYKKEGKEQKVESKTMKLHFFPSEKGGEFEALLPVDYDIELGPKTLQLSRPGEKDVTLISFEVVDGKYSSETLKVAQDKVVPPAKVEKRIVREMKLLNQTYAHSANTKLWNGVFKRPMSSVTTSVYGGKRLYNGIKKNYHAGLDFKAAVGSEIFAPANGKVVLAQDLYFSGNTVIIDHGLGVFSIYMHMSRFLVKEGEAVVTGKKLGLSGKTGRITGPHLHWGVQIQGVKIDPLEVTREELLR